MGVVVSLCDLTGTFLRPWAEAGYECYAVDVEHSMAGWYGYGKTEADAVADFIENYAEDHLERLGA